MDNKHVTIHISPTSVLTTLLILVAAYLLWFLRDIAMLVITSIVLASAIEPGIAFFSKYKISRALSVLVMYLIVFGSFFSIIYFFSPPLLEDTQQMIQQFPTYIESIHLPESLQQLQTAAQNADAGGANQTTLDTILSFRSAFTDAGGGALSVISGIFGGLASLLLVIVLSFYFAVIGTGVDDFLKLVTPTSHEKYVLSLWKRSHEKIGQWMQGQLILSILSAVIIYLGLLILGVPYALLLAVLTAVAELIPIFGSFIAAIPAIIIAFTTGGLTLALIVAGLYLIMNLLQANLIYPLVVKKIVGIPPLMVILSLIIGGTLGGFLGVFLAVPLVAALRELLNDVDKGKRAKAMSA
jgi:predicted PurR-regulated permease PerM